MEVIKTFFDGAIELGMFLVFGVPAIIIAVSFFGELFQRGNILSFEGRINRKKFIINTFLIMIIGFIACFVFIFLAEKMESYIATITAVVAAAATVIAYYANIARRLHDINQSAWWGLIYFAVTLFLNFVESPLAFIAPILIILLAAIPGTKGANKYGMDPLEENSSANCN